MSEVLTQLKPRTWPSKLGWFFGIKIYFTLPGWKGSYRYSNAKFQPVGSYMGVFTVPQQASRCSCLFMFWSATGYTELNKRCFHQLVKTAHFFSGHLGAEFCRGVNVKRHSTVRDKQHQCKPWTLWINHSCIGTLLENKQYHFMYIYYCCLGELVLLCSQTWLNPAILKPWYSLYRQLHYWLPHKYCGLLKKKLSDRSDYIMIW